MKSKISKKIKDKVYKAVRKQFQELSKEQVRKICNTAFKLVEK